IAGQWDAFFLLALAGALWLERVGQVPQPGHRRRAAVAGLGLALVGSVKPYPLLTLGYFVVRRRWWTVLSALAGLALFFGLAYLLLGRQESLTFLRRVAPHL